jgi:hypothetical protein
LLFAGTAYMHVCGGAEIPSSQKQKINTQK